MLYRKRQLIQKEEKILRGAWKSSRNKHIIFSIQNVLIWLTYSQSHYVQVFIHIIFYLEAMRKVWLILLFWWRNWSSERINYSPKVVVWDSRWAQSLLPTWLTVPYSDFFFWAYATVVNPCFKKVKINRAFVLASMYPIWFLNCPSFGWLPPQVKVLEVFPALYHAPLTSRPSSHCFYLQQSAQLPLLLSSKY